MADDIIQFSPGAKVTAEETNENNLLLKEWALDNTASEAYIDNKIDTLTENLNNQILLLDSSTVKTTGNQTIAGNKTFSGTTTLNGNVAGSTAAKATITQWGMPNYTAKANRSSNTNYTAATNGWLYVEHNGDNSAKYTVTVSGVRAAHSYGWKYTTENSALIPIQKGAVYKVTEYSGIRYCYWIPCVGG